jgi:hypothetical protein
MGARKPRARCHRGRCRRRPWRFGLCRPHAVLLADQRCREAVFERYRCCVNCGARHSLQWAHVVSRRYWQTRWHPDNSVVLCARCHVYYTHRPLEWWEFVARFFGTEHMERLRDLALRGRRDLEDLIAEQVGDAEVS